MNNLLQSIIAFVLFIFLLPVYVALVILGIVFQGFPVLYSERRLGLHKKEFTIWKFRSMHTRSQDAIMRIHKSPADPRITAWGHFLRRFSLDELPQLWNVIKGEMALVGPRPIFHQEDLLYGKYSDQVHSVKPGLTGLWQVSGRNLTTYHRRIAMNLYYVRHQSWRLDLWILLKTVSAVISGRGAY